ncbi:hypothetical protein [Saccharibacillus kuerlensis]|uniref:Helix-turn-helix domain-containing protein n=1 Tax=Saccharibacillus kuerlensis TaxID=459527 RepID=A0ABQ2L4Y7_9BACL|nr:hypothetical protein [Saccharibacillus kuerlensis]GGO03565.1 hypothetical protein GCM10010969_27900 [Saccharibacillus kuerlensis]
MKRFNFSMLLSSIILGASLIIGCVLIQKELNVQETEVPKETKNEPKVLMNMEETAEYLGLTEQQVKEIIKTENRELSETGSFIGVMFPYIKIDDEILISRDRLKEWVKESTTQRNEYESGS